MANDRTRVFAKLKYRDPRAVLVDLRRLEATVAASDASFAVKNLRTRELRPLRELREACLFCYGMTECTGGPKFLVAHAEEQDYDAVATWNVVKLAPDMGQQKARRGGCRRCMRRRRCLQPGAAEPGISIDLQQPAKSFARLDARPRGPRCTCRHI